MTAVIMFKDNGIPLYRQLYESLKNKISSGEWPLNRLIPPETTLMKTYGVGRETIRRAILQLVNEGYLYRRRGRGTVVCRRRAEDGLEQVVSFSAEMFSRGIEPGAELLEYDPRLEPTGEVADVLGAAPGERVLYFKRRRKANNLPVAVEDSYVLADVFGALEPEKLNSSFYNYLVYEKQIKPGRITLEISSVSADAETARLLEIKTGDPLLRLTRVIRTGGGRPFFYLVFLFRGDIYTLKTDLL